MDYDPGPDCKRTGTLSKLSDRRTCRLCRGREDIVCAAVSALVINTINSIEEFTGDAFTCDCRDGMIRSWEFTSEVSKETELLMDSLMLGLSGIQKSYGEMYLQIEE